MLGKLDDENKGMSGFYQMRNLHQIVVHHNTAAYADGDFGQRGFSAN